MTPITCNVPHCTQMVRDQIQTTNTRHNKKERCHSDKNMEWGSNFSSAETVCSIIHFIQTIRFCLNLREQTAGTTRRTTPLLLKLHQKSTYNILFQSMIDEQSFSALNRRFTVAMTTVLTQFISARGFMVDPLPT